MTARLKTWLLGRTIWLLGRKDGFTWLLGRKAWLPVSKRKLRYWEKTELPDKKREKKILAGRKEIPFKELTKRTHNKELKYGC